MDKRTSESLGIDIVEAHCCVRVNRSQVKEQICNRKWVKKLGTFQPRRSLSAEETEGEGESGPIDTKLSR